MKETRLKAEEAMTEQKKFETNVIEKARKENEGRYGKLAERMERLEREMEEEKKKKKKKNNKSSDATVVKKTLSYDSMYSRRRFW